MCLYEINLGGVETIIERNIYDGAAVYISKEGRAKISDTHFLSGLNILYSFFGKKFKDLV